MNAGLLSIPLFLMGWASAVFMLGSLGSGDWSVIKRFSCGAIGFLLMAVFAFLAFKMLGL
jgi:hypothetical protein